MAVKIRLKRMGAKKKPFYRIVVADSRKSRDGQVIEELGYYDPLKEPAEVKVDLNKARKWISNGAQPTDIVKALLNKNGIADSPAEEEASMENASEQPTETPVAAAETVTDEAAGAGETPEPSDTDE